MPHGARVVVTRIRARHLVLSMHRWTGLVLGLFIALSAVTGIGLAFRPQLEPQVYAGLMQSSRCAKQAPLDQLVAAGLAAHPSSTVNYIRIYRNPGAPARLRFANNDTLYLDRC